MRSSTSIINMIKGLVRTAEFVERDSPKGEIWDDESRKALEEARRRGWGKNQIGSIAFDAEDAIPVPIPMILTCPMWECGARHIDEGEFETKAHHTHACQKCGHVWRPAVVHTVGVRFLPGYKNETVKSPPPAPRPVPPPPRPTEGG